MTSNAARPRRVPLPWVAAIFIPLAAFVYLTGWTASPDDAGIGYQTLAGISVFAVFSGVLVGCVFLQRRYVGTPLLGWPGWWRLLVEAAIAVPIAIAWAYALSLGARWLSPEMLRGDEVVYKPVAIAAAIYCLVGFTVGPLAEEMLYRSLLYDSLRGWMGPSLAVLLQALLFGVMHRWGWAIMCMAFASGLLFMGLRLWRRTLWSPFLVHAGIDAPAYLGLLIAIVSASGHTMLGISMADDPRHAKPSVIGIVRGSAAQQAQLKVGDIIAAIDGQPIRDSAEVKRIVAGHKLAGTIHLTLVRNGQTIEVPVELRVLRPQILW